MEELLGDVLLCVVVADVVKGNGTPERVELEPVGHWREQKASNLITRLRQLWIEVRGKMQKTFEREKNEE